MALCSKKPKDLKIDRLILYEDNHLLVLNKPGGLLVQGDRTGDETLLTAAKNYLKEKYQKPGRVFLALVHRLDRVTSGVVVFARTSKAASRLALAFRERKVKKFYLAVVHGHPPPNETLEGKILFDKKSRRAYLHRDGKPARLSYQMLKKHGGYSLLLVQPETGRKHQIRVQLAAKGYPIVGDLKYGSHERVASGRAILLHAWQILLPHPTLRKEILFSAPLPKYWPSYARLNFTLN